MSEDSPKLWPARATKELPSRLFVAVIVVAFGILYLATAARSLQGGDSGELLVVTLRGGLAHPPGYPLYTLLAGVWTTIPALNPILSTSLFSGACAIAAMVFLYWGLLRWGFSNTAAGVAASVIGVTPVFWRYAGVPEVFALNALCFALLLWSTGRFGGPKGALRAGLVGLLFGLGLSNHPTIIFAAPIVAVGWVRAHREAQRRFPVQVPAMALFGLALGLTPYLSLLAAESTDAWAWAGGFDLSSLVDHVLRRDFGMVALGGGDQSPALFQNTTTYFVQLAMAFVIVLPVGVWGILISGRVGLNLRRLDEDAMDAAALLGTFLLLAVVFLSLLNLRPEGHSRSVIERFYLLPNIAFATLCCVGLDHILVRRPRFEVYTRAFAVGVVCMLVVDHVDEADWSEDYAVEDYIFNALDTVDAGGVIVGTGDLQLFGFLAASELFAYRTDVAYVDLDLLRYDWYYNRVRERLPHFTTPYDSERTHVVDVVINLQQSHPVYMADIGQPVPALEDLLIPVGPLLEILPPEKTPPSPLVIGRTNQTVFNRLQFRGSPPTQPDSWGGLAYSYYARSWLSLATSFQQMGLSENAARMRSYAEPFIVLDQ